MRVATAKEQVGVSPKVKLPAAVQAALAVVLLVIGYVIGDNTVTAIGYALLGASGVTGGLGFLARPGRVRVG